MTNSSEPEISSVSDHSPLLSFEQASEEVKKFHHLMLALSGQDDFIKGRLIPPEVMKQRALQELRKRFEKSLEALLQFAQRYNNLYARLDYYIKQADKILKKLEKSGDTPDDVIAKIGPEEDGEAEEEQAESNNDSRLAKSDAGLMARGFKALVKGSGKAVYTSVKTFRDKAESLRNRLSNMNSPDEAELNHIENDLAASYEPVADYIEPYGDYYEPGEDLDYGAA